MAATAEQARAMRMLRLVGEAAFARGATLQQCPYGDPLDAQCWRLGWQDGQDAAALAQLETQAPAPYRPRGGYYRGR